MIDMPSGAVVGIQNPGPPAISVPTPTATEVVVVPTPGPPGLTELGQEQIEDITDDILDSLGSGIDWVVLFENGLI